MSTLQDLNKVLSRKQAILDENAAGVEQQKKSGKQTARERIAMLLDGGSFVEQSMLAQDAGVVAGSGTVDGRPVEIGVDGEADLSGHTSNGMAWYIEVKLPGETPRKDQQRFLEAMIAGGALAGCAHTVKEALEIVTGKEKSK